MSSLLKKIVIFALILFIVIFASLSVSDDFKEELTYNFQPKPKKSWVGDYLSGYSAMQNNDYDKASQFFSDSIKYGKEDEYLKSKTLTLLLVAGRYDQAFEVANKIFENDESAISGLTLIVQHVAKEDYIRASQIAEDLKKEGQNTILHQIIYAWLKLGEGNKLTAQDLMKKMAKDVALEPLISYHYALISELSGNDEKAAKLYKKITEGTNFNNAIATSAYRFFKKTGDEKAAEDIFNKFENEDNFLKYHEIKNAKDGISEAFLGVAGIIMSEYRSDKSAAFFRLAIYLNPALDEARILLASILIAESDYKTANNILLEIKDDSYLSNYAKLAIARNYRELGDDAKAKKYYQDLTASENARLDALVSLGDIERSEKNWEKAEDYYSKAIQDIEEKEGEVTSQYWAIYFARGVCYERLKDWEKAERDFKFALQLEPNQPDVLNYLGYSWVDMGINIDQAMDMLKQAYAQRPDDAHVIDSVAWAYYKLGEYDKAVKLLEESVSIIPYDPTVNDHLGDAYWEVGRKSEARFQWQRALENDPEEDEIPKIEAKLKNGKNANLKQEIVSDEVVINEVESTR